MEKTAFLSATFYLGKELKDSSESADVDSITSRKPHPSGQTQPTKSSEVIKGTKESKPTSPSEKTKAPKSTGVTKLTKPQSNQTVVTKPTTNRPVDKTSTRLKPSMWSK